MTFNVNRYTPAGVIKSLRCVDTQALFETGKCRRFSGISSVATRKLAQLDAAHTLEFLRSPPARKMSRSLTTTDGELQ